MFPTKSGFVTSALLTGFALLLPLAASSAAFAQSQPGIVLAQQEPPKAGEEKGKKDEHHPPGPAKAGQPPAAQQNAPALGKPGEPKKAEEPQGHPPAAQGAPPQHPTAQEEPRKQEELHKQPPAVQTQQTPTPQQPNQKQPPASAQEHEEHGHTPPAAQSQTTPNKTPTAQEPNQKAAPALGQQSNPPRPAVGQSQPVGQPGAPTAQVRRVPPPTEQVGKSQDFIHAPGQPAAPGIAALRGERHEVHEGNRTVIQEADRTIIQEGGHSIIRHNEVDRFAVGARSVHNEQRGNQTFSVVVQADGSSIESLMDADGRLIRRTRRDPSGHEIVIIDNSWVTPQESANFVIDLPVPVINIPRERYIVDMDHAVEADIFAALTAPPIERIERRYSLDEVLYSPMLRDRMPRIDLDTITFDTGSWQIGPEEFNKLAWVADALQRAIARNPREIFLIEGHTDAVGSDVDNLSLSDRRAETIAVVLTEQFHVPAENLATQGYGSQFLKIPTQEAERQNRRVAVRRITPLLDPDGRAGG
jgi:outer membrane protein OmpA-like peptidoglycan-associated protein